MSESTPSKRRRIESGSEEPPAPVAVVKVTKEFHDFGYYTGDWDPATKKPHGAGEWERCGTTRYIGNWEQGVWSGYGTVFDEGGARVCSGNFSGGQPHGFCTRYADDGEAISEECYLVYGEACTDVKTEEEFEAAAEEARREKRRREELRRKSQPPPSARSTISFSATLTADSPIMSAPIEGLFPRYAAVPVAMLNGADFTMLDDDDIPTPTNLETGKTRDDWLVWVRKFFPRKVD